ncbi:MAG TPA: DUF6089 family protein [Bacteroidales bacterium]|nr:DUF6089 family protein [Bacteroidales bacterium]HSA42863.1 DUF6089 family protein [Bacteroidales bacterium]
MTIRYFLLCLCLSVLVFEDAGAQIKSKYLRRFRSREFGFSIGATNLIGELGGANRIGSESFSLRDFDFPAVRPTLGFSMGFQVMDEGNVKTNLVIGYLRGNDKFTDYISRKQRNINYRSVLIELSEQFEYFLIQGKKTRTSYNLQTRNEKFSFKNLPFTLYVFTGIAGFYFNPQNQDKEGTWRNVKPYHTEGQGDVETRKKYNLVQISIPLGIGVKYPLGKGYSLGFEYGFRKTFTDYLDDASMTYFDEAYLLRNYGPKSVELSNPSGKPWLVAGQQRGDPRDKDVYLFALITLYRDMSRISRIRNFRF